MRTRVLVIAALAAVTLAGCGQAGAPGTAAPSPAKSQVAGGGQQVDVKSGPPARVSIPKIGADSSLVQVGLKADGSMEIPPADQPMQAAWYKQSPIPGNKGPAIIVGHVDGNSQPGIFFRLKELAAGDKVTVTGADGGTTSFVVTRTQQVNKDQVPDEVYNATAGSELRLITCGGSFDQQAGSYRDNIIVYAKAG